MKEYPIMIQNYLRNWKNLSLKDGILFYRTSIRGEEVDQIVLPESAKQNIFKTLHGDMCHQGRDRTINLFKDSFYWPVMDSDITLWLNQCDKCIRRNVPPTLATGFMNIFSSAPMKLVSIDYLSLEVSKVGFENIIAIMDHSILFRPYQQKIRQLGQLQNLSLTISFYFTVFPKNSTQTKARSFLSIAINRFCRIAGIKRSMTTSYHPQSNGQVEKL